MYTSPHTKRSDSWKGPKKSFGGPKPWDRGSKGGSFNSFDKPQLHPATCADCGNSCMVPFKPNGKKPIFCSNCFVKDEGGAAPKRFGADRPTRSFSAPAAGGADIEAQLKKINAKLDLIIEALED